MIAFLDVAYGDTTARAAFVVAKAWTDAEPAFEHAVVLEGIQPYQPGQFYLRELPPLLQVLAQVTVPIGVVVVDGYVWLGRHPGLGARLHQALVGSPLAAAAVIGVAKTRWHGDPADVPPREQRVVDVLRGKSAKPLHVTALGVDPDVAANHVRDMHGASRMPTLLRRVDALSRWGVK